jgi:hypothetical protein
MYGTNHPKIFSERFVMYTFCHDTFFLIYTFHSRHLLSPSWWRGGGFSHTSALSSHSMSNVSIPCMFGSARKWGLKIRLLSTYFLMSRFPSVCSKHVRYRRIITALRCSILQYAFLLQSVFSTFFLSLNAYYNANRFIAYIKHWHFQ